MNEQHAVARGVFGEEIEV
jgi:hypothetical protein